MSEILLEHMLPHMKQVFLRISSFCCFSLLKSAKVSMMTPKIKLSTIMMTTKKKSMSYTTRAPNIGSFENILMLLQLLHNMLHNIHLVNLQPECSGKHGIFFFQINRLKTLAISIKDNLIPRNKIPCWKVPGEYLRYLHRYVILG